MQNIFNVYCDESCHLENDGQKAMVLGAVWCPDAKRREISERIRDLKRIHHLGREFEIKWTKVSRSKVAFYTDVLKFFFEEEDLHFRGLIVPDKSILNHSQYQQDHEEWYYKMYFTMLKTIFSPDSTYRVYIDIKDTLGHERVSKLHEVLCNNAMDYSRNMIGRVQRIHSHESEQLQLADLIIGALGYFHRGLSSNSAKLDLIQLIQEHSGYELNRTTLSRENKLNLLIWKGGQV